MKHLPLLLTLAVLAPPVSGASPQDSAPDERPRLPADVTLPDPAPDLLLIDGWVGDGAPELVRAARAAGTVTVDATG